MLDRMRRIRHRRTPWRYSYRRRWGETWEIRDLNSIVDSSGDQRINILGWTVSKNLSLSIALAVELHPGGWSYYWFP